MERTFAPVFKLADLTHLYIASGRSVIDCRIHIKIETASAVYIPRSQSTSEGEKCAIKNFSKMLVPSVIFL